MQNKCVRRKVTEALYTTMLLQFVFNYLSEETKRRVLYDFQNFGESKTKFVADVLCVELHYLICKTPQTVEVRVCKQVSGLQTLMIRVGVELDTV